MERRRRLLLLLSSEREGSRTLGPFGSGEGGQARSTRSGSAREEEERGERLWGGLVVVLFFLSFSLFSSTSSAVFPSTATHKIAHARTDARSTPTCCCSCLPLSRALN